MAPFLRPAAEPEPLGLLRDRPLGPAQLLADGLVRMADRVALPQLIDVLPGPYRSSHGLLLRGDRPVIGLLVDPSGPGRGQDPRTVVPAREVDPARLLPGLEPLIDRNG